MIFHWLSVNKFFEIIHNYLKLIYFHFQKNITKLLNDNNLHILKINLKAYKQLQFFNQLMVTLNPNAQFKRQLFILMRIFINKNYKI